MKSAKQKRKGKWRELWLPKIILFFSMLVSYNSTIQRQTHNLYSVSSDKLSMQEYMIMSNTPKDFIDNYLQFYVLSKLKFKNYVYRIVIWQFHIKMLGNQYPVKKLWETLDQYFFQCFSNVLKTTKMMEINSNISLVFVLFLFPLNIKNYIQK